jgi:hypothetical protein
VFHDVTTTDFQTEREGLFMILNEMRLQKRANKLASWSEEPNPLKALIPNPKKGGKMVLRCPNTSSIPSK